jgi:hypothetical protein
MLVAAAMKVRGGCGARSPQQPARPAPAPGVRTAALQEAAPAP